jgi:hypothetical protein
VPLETDVHQESCPDARVQSPEVTDDEIFEEVADDEMPEIDIGYLKMESD